MTDDLIEVNDIWFKNAKEKLDFIDFWKENANPNDAKLKKENGDAIRGILLDAFNFPANLRFGDSNSNSILGKCFDPMGGIEGKLTSDEEKILSTYRSLLDIRTFKYPPNEDTYYMDSSSGRPDLQKFEENTYTWRIQCTEDNEICAKGMYATFLNIITSLTTF